MVTILLQPSHNLVAAITGVVIHELGYIPELPESLVLSTETSVVPGVSVATYVAQPYIKSSISKEIGKALILQVSQPVSAGSNETML